MARQSMQAQQKHPGDTYEHTADRISWAEAHGKHLVYIMEKGQ